MSLTIKGLQKTTLIDYPDKVACTIFLPDCNFRCGFCHNKDLVLNPDSLPTTKEEEILDFLKERKKWLDGVCISGGEPLLHHELLDFLPKLKELGYLIKIDTNDSNPEFLKELIGKKLIDFVAMDIKNSLEDYDKTAGVKVDTEKINKSIEIIKNSGIDYEFRTTVIPGLHTKENIEKIGKLLKKAKKFAIQNFRPSDNVIDPKYKKHKSFSREELEEFKKILEPYFDEVEIRA